MNNQDKKKRVPFSAVVYIILSLGFFCIAGYFFKMSYMPLKDTELVSVSGPVTKNLFVNTDRRHRQSVAIYLNQFPAIEFLLASGSFKASTPQMLVSSVHAGDSLTIGIKKGDFAKILHDSAYLEKHYVSIYRLFDKKREYLTLDRYNEQIDGEIGETRYFLPLVLILMGLFLGSLGVRGIQKARETD